MIESMTGFGRGRAATPAADLTAEVRTVNGRYAEVSLRAPHALAAHEAALQQRAREALERGRISATLTLRRHAAPAPLSVDRAAAAALRRMLDELREAAGIDEPVRLEDLLRFPEILLPAEEEPEADDELLRAAERALDEALEATRRMRRREGAALEADLRARLGAIERELEAVEADAPARIEAAREALHERLAEVLGDERVDRERLELEIALLADRLDVNEECVRLRAHLAAFREALARGGPVGRTLNFLAQEFNREINTIASKANDAAIAQRAVRMKDELEKIREQVQNVV